jgi:hypothetical protein
MVTLLDNSTRDSSFRLFRVKTSSNEMCGDSQIFGAGLAASIRYKIHMARVGVPLALKQQCSTGATNNERWPNRRRPKYGHSQD